MSNTEKSDANISANISANTSARTAAAGRWHQRTPVTIASWLGFALLAADATWAAPPAHGTASPQAITRGVAVSSRRSAAPIATRR